MKVDEHLLTSHPRVYACGDITGYSLLAHTAIREAEVAINHILEEDWMNYDCVPGVVYTNPEVAEGKTEEELVKSEFLRFQNYYGLFRTVRCGE